VPTLNLDPIQLAIVIALAAQLPVAALAILTVFSQRKRLADTHLRPGPMPSRRESSAPPPLPAERAAKTPEAPPPAPAPVPVPEAPEALAPPEVEAAPAAPEISPPPEAPAPPIEIAPEPQPEATEVEVAPPDVLATPPPESAPEPEAPAPPIELAPPEVPAVAPEAPPREPVKIGLGLRKTRENFLARIRSAITGATRIDEIYEGLEEALIGADVGVDGSLKLVEAVRARLKNDARPEVIRDALKDEIERVLLAAERPLADSGDAPLVIMLAGVNGVGKTTTIAKLAAALKAERGPVLVAAADTFRAAAIDQLQVWCERVGVDLIKQKPGSDPAAVAFDAVKAAVARSAKSVLIDTAGRLQTKVNLMEELKKIARVVGRELPGAPHETWLVLDATTGQNALSQAKLFGEAVPLTGVVLAKLDSTAKGGVIVGIAERLKLPVRFVGLGENIEDLRAFDAHEFVEALFSESVGGEQDASGSYAA
jgi:fused signal recognition particle receptor